MEVLAICVSLAILIAYVASRLRTWRGELLMERNVTEIPLPAKLLILGPSGAGKSTLHWHALSMAAGEPTRSADARIEHLLPVPTRGLVRQLAAIPSSSGTYVEVELCDAGGGLHERRQWVHLVRDGPVHVLVFVADSIDTSDDTRHLFEQLANAPWATTTRVFLALTKVDILEQRLDADSLAIELRKRSDAYRLSARSPIVIHALNNLNSIEARRLLSEAVDACVSAELPATRGISADGQTVLRA